MNNTPLLTSRLPGFYREPVAERVETMRRRGALSADADRWLAEGGGLSLAAADRMTENVIGTFGLPLSVGLNFTINGVDRLLPMVVEEPSVVAAASHAARIVRLTGGFVGHATASVMTAQVQLDRVLDVDAAIAAIETNSERLIAIGNQAIPRMVARGGGCQAIEARILDREDGWVVIHIHVDVGEAMGANLVDAVAEAVGPAIAELAGGRLGLRILTNLPLRRTVTVRCTAANDDLGGAEAVDAILRAARFAQMDPYRAVTHNKGIMNGVDAVAVATGQDWRAIEAGAHAYAALEGGYRPLSNWRRGEQGIVGELTMPLAVGTVGGATRIHPGVRAGLELLGDIDAQSLAVAIAAAGLATNLAALRALAGEGIQRGHMQLHARRTNSDAATQGTEP